MDRDLKRSIILDNYQNPNMKHTSNEDYVKINTRNVSCICLLYTSPSPRDRG